MKNLKKGVRWPKKSSHQKGEKNALKQATQGLTIDAEAEPGGLQTGRKTSEVKESYRGGPAPRKKGKTERQK